MLFLELSLAPRLLLLAAWQQSVAFGNGAIAALAKPGIRTHLRSFVRCSVRMNSPTLLRNALRVTLSTLVSFCDYLTRNSGTSMYISMPRLALLEIRSAASRIAAVYCSLFVSNRCVGTARLTEAITPWPEL